MPSNLSFLDTNFPSFTDEDSTEKKINTIQDYLYMTVESLRYALSHLNEGNMEQSFVDSVISGNGAIAEIKQTVADHSASITELARVTGEQGDSIAELDLAVEEDEAKLSLVVSSPGGVNTVNTASIVAAVNSSGSSIKINADKIQMTGTTTFLTPADVGASGSTVIDGGRITTGTITFNRLDSSAQSTINTASTNASTAITTANSASSTASAAATTASSAYTKASNVEDTVDGWTYGSTTYIDGTQLMTGTVTATKLKGGSVSLLDSDGDESGIFSITGASSGSFAIDIKSNAALRLRAYGGDVFLGARTSSSSSDTAFVQIFDDGYVKVAPSLVYQNYGTSEPGSSTPGYGTNGALYFKYS